MDIEAKILMVFLCVALISVLLGIVVYEIYMHLPIKSSKKVLAITLDDVDTLRVGIASDSQLPGSKTEKTLEKDHLRSCFELLKEQGINMLVFPGDFTDYASRYSYGTFIEVLKEVFPEDDPARPYMFFVMGNHDMWFPYDYHSVAPKHRFYKKMMSVDPNVHWKVNGFHFIGVSPDDTSNADGFSGTMRKFIENEIRKAEADSPEGQPIFVVTHHNVPATALGSSQWGDERVRQAVSNHPQVVHISGHSHVSILDERSISQNVITAFTTQSLAYVDMENNMFNAFNGINDKGEFSKRNAYCSAPVACSEKPMCLIMNVGKKDIVIERWNVLEKKEEKANMRWTLEYPINNGNFDYRDSERQASSVPPTFPQGTTIFYNASIKSPIASSAATLPGISFAAAHHSDLVCKYTVMLTNKNTGAVYSYDTYSDYYLGIANMASEVSIAIDPTLPMGTYAIQVFAYESFGKRSEPITTELDWKQPDIKIIEDVIEK